VEWCVSTGVGAGQAIGDCCFQLLPLSGGGSLVGCYEYYDSDLNGNNMLYHGKSFCVPLPDPYS